MGQSVTRVTGAVAEDGESDAVDLIFFGSDGGIFSTIGNFSAGWDLVVVDKEDGVGAKNVVTKTLCEVAKVIGIGV